ncbi:MAG TPA: OmpA family protein [Deltaproteobacteria bacterium]|nr:OmpA family protein [Deltaproteobacteria bacterium]
MRKALIILVIVVLAAGSLGGVVFYRKNIQKDSQISDQLEQIEALKREISKLDQDAAGFLKQSAANQKRIKSLEDGKQHVVQLESLMKEKDEALAAAQKESDALKVSARDLEIKLKYEQASLQSQGEKLQTAQAQIENLTTELEGTTRSRTDLETQVAKLKDQLIMGREETQGLAMKLKKEQTEKQTLKRELAQAHDNIYREQIEFQNKQKELEAAQSRIVNLQQEIQKNEKVKAELEEKVSGLTTQIRTLKKDRYEGQLAFQNNQKELEAAQSEIVMLKEEVQKNQAVKAILEKEASGFKAQLLDLKDTHQRIQTLQEEIQKTIDINSLLKNQISILQLQLNNYQEKTLNYAGTMEEKESQLKLIVSNLNNCLINSKDVAASLQTAQSQVVNLKGMVEQARAEQVVMSKQLSNIESEKAEMALKLADAKKTYDTLIRELHDKIETKETVIKDCEKKFSVTFIDRVLFHSGRASIMTEGREILKKAGDILSEMRFGVIRIAGHTDNVPIRREWRERYPTNWELSSARAAAVARFFQKASNVAPEKMEVVGFGSTRPIASNATSEGQAKNRRVEITIVPMGSKVRAAP